MCCIVPCLHQPPPVNKVLESSTAKETDKSKCLFHDSHPTVTNRVRVSVRYRVRFVWHSDYHLGRE